jgi:hypothetical protein
MNIHELEELLQPGKENKKSIPSEGIKLFTDIPVSYPTQLKDLHSGQKFKFINGYSYDDHLYVFVNIHFPSGTVLVEDMRSGNRHLVGEQAAVVICPI